MQRFISILLLASVLAAPAAAAEPDVLTLNEAAQLAIERQPQLEAYDYAANAAREAAVAEAQLPDPVLKLGTQYIPINGNDALSFDSEDMSMNTVGVMQQMVRPDKRQADSNRMQAKGEQWQLERVAEARQLRRDAKLAWTDAYETAQRATLYGRIASELAAERKIAGQKISTGAITASEVFQLDTMLADVNDQRIAAESASKRARAKLSRWLGDAAFRPLPAMAADDHKILMQPLRLTQASLDNHPQLAVRRKAEDVARLEAQRARADHQSDWSWEVMYSQRSGGRSDLVSVQIAIPLQIDQAHRQDRRLAEKLALVDRAHSMTLDQQRQLHAEFLAVQADYEAAQARVREHEARLIPAADARLQTAMARYAAGTLPLSAVWQARRGVNEAEDDHVMIKAELLRAAIRYEYLSGETP
jgi:outer membrane protein TolC